MDGLKTMAVQSYNQRWTEDQKTEFDIFFNGLDSDGDKKVSFEELRDKDIISKNVYYVFTKLDNNKNGALDFEEVLCLYYYKFVMAEVVKSYNPSARFCKGSLCPRLQTSPDFSCFLCLNKKFRRSYHLCSSCHTKGVHIRKHEHPEYYLLNRQALDVVDKMKDMLFEDDDKAQKYPADNMEIAETNRVMAAGIMSMVTSTISVMTAAGACTIM